MPLIRLGKGQWNLRGWSDSSWSCPTPSWWRTQTAGSCGPILPPSGSSAWPSPTSSASARPDFLLDPEDLELAATSLVSVRDKNVGSPIELRVKTPTGWKLVELIGANLVGKRPINGLVWCLRDLTERRRWEVANNDIEQFRSLVHNSASILLLLDGTGTVRSVSAAITRMLGHDQALVEGHPLEDLAVPADRPALRAAIASALDNGQVDEGPTIVEVDLRRRDGGVPIPCEFRASSICSTIRR